MRRIFLTIYVVEYVNKTNRSMSNLQRELIKLQDEYLDRLQRINDERRKQNVQRRQDK